MLAVVALAGVADDAALEEAPGTGGAGAAVGAGADELGIEARGHVGGRGTGAPAQHGQQPGTLRVREGGLAARGRAGQPEAQGRERVRSLQVLVKDNVPDTDGARALGTLAQGVSKGRRRGWLRWVRGVVGSGVQRTQRLMSGVGRCLI